MKQLNGLAIACLIACLITTAASGASQSQELLTSENMRQWASAIDGRYRGTINLDEQRGQIQFNTFDARGHTELIVVDQPRDDYRVDCVVSFSALHDKYSGLSFHLRVANGNRYWVYWRPKSRGFHALKVRSNSHTIAEYEAGKRQADRPDPIELNRDYTFSVEIVGRRIRAFIDGEQLLEFVDPMPSMYQRGSIGLASGSSDLTIKSLKITDLSVSQMLPVASYTYVNPPEKGDSSGSILTDGRFNGKDEQALWWLATKGDPAVTFDLGETRFVNGIRLKAFAAADSNISAYRIFGSIDGETWRVMASEVNDSSDSREQEQVLEAQLAGLARYVRVMLFRSAGDATIKLDEVEILGREARADDAVTVADDKPYYDGQALPTIGAAGDADDHWFYMQGGGLRAAISRAGGYLGPVVNVAHEQACTMVSYDSYYVETRDSEEAVSERDNVVVDVERDDDGLRLTCRNDGIANVDIIQTYRVTEHGISKTTEMINRGSAPDLFVTVRTGSILDEQFRTGGWYLGADRGLGGRMAASQVTLDMTPTCHSPKNTKVVLFMRYDVGYGIGQYRHQINGEYCNPITSRYFEKSNHAPVYTANGWRVGLITLHLEPDTTRSVQVRWNLFEEDEFNFFKQYASIPEVHERFGVERPDWLLRLKSSFSDFGFAFISPHNRELVMAAIKRTTDLYDDGYIYYLTSAGDVWGDWYHGERWSYGWSGDKVDNDYVRALFDALREQSPSLKVGVYTWAWTGWAYSQTYTDHPEWYIDRNKEGYYKKGYQNGPMNYLRRLSAPGSMEDYLTSVDAMIEQFDPDHFYIDGGGGGSNVIDWQRLALDYDTDWQRFHWSIFHATRKHDERERVMFTNSRSEGFVDIGFYEGINNVLSENTWRESGDALLALKMRSSVFPKITYMPIYWRTNTLPFYSNYCIGLGLVPENIYTSRELRNVAYVTAAYETRMMRFVTADLTPDWRKDTAVELEAYALTHEPAAIFSVINHSKLPVPQTVSADAARLGIDTNKPIFSWLIRMYDSRLRETGVSERTAKDVYQRTGWGIDLVAAPQFRGVVEAESGRLTATEQFDLNVLNMVTFSNCPAVVYSANGRRQQIWQPNARGIVVDGDIDLDQRAIHLTTTPTNTADVERAQLLVFVPNDWSKLNVTGAASWQMVFIGAQRFVQLTIDHFGDITIHAGESRSYEIATRGELVIDPVAVPAALQLDLPDGAHHVTAYHNDVPVYFGASNDLHLPHELASGRYRIVARSNDAVYSADVEVQSDWQYDHPDIRPPRAPAHLEQTAVDRTVGDLRVLGTAVHSHDDISLPQFTEVDPDKLYFAAGSLDTAATRGGFAMAGLELAGVRVLQLDVRNTFFRHWSNYERETWRPGSSTAFAGLIVDYHTPDGYTKRVGLSMGLVQPQSDSALPGYGAKRKIDLFVRLEDYIHLSNRAQFALDLGRWAPADWDGRVWISAATNGGVYAGRRLFVTITGTDDRPENVPFDHGQIITRELEQPHIDVPIIESPVTVDGTLDDAAWEQAASSDSFTLTTSMRPPDEATRMYICRDDEHLYIGVRCEESQREHLMADGEKVWTHDAIDVTFAPLPRSKHIHKFVINYENTVYQETRPPGVEQENWQVRTATSQADGVWYVEMAIPLHYVKLSDGTIAFNLLRYHPSPTGIGAFTWSLIPLEDYLDPQWFGTIGF